MECYVLSKTDLSILSICKLADYQINLDEETNAKSTFTLMKTNGLKKENYMVLNGLYRQFIFVIDDVQTEKSSDVATVTALDISNIFDRKVIEKNIDIMKSKSIEEFLANTISENFVNSDDTALNVNYIEIYWHTNTQGNVATNAENGLYNFHTFLTNCRQYKNIYTDFKLENLGNPQTVEGKRINVEAKNRKIVDISLHGESTQSGTPTPDNPIDIENVEGNIEFKVEGKNRFGNFDWITGVYAYTLIPKSNNKYILSMKLKEGKTIPSDLYLGFTSKGDYNNANIFKWIISAGSFHTTLITNNGFRYINNVISDTPLNYISVFPTTYATKLEEYFEIQLEEGTEPTDYEPYKSQVATFPLREEKLYQGSFLNDNGKNHTRKQYEFTGNETGWNYNSAQNAFWIKNSEITNCKIQAHSKLCNYFSYTSESYTVAPANTLCESSNSTIPMFIFKVSTDVANSLETWKTWLQNHNLIVEYELAEPETVPYTEEQQEAWNNIKNLTLFEGVNHISSDANMVLKYYPLEPVGLKFVLRIDIENKQETTELIDTTLPEVADYNKIYEEDVTAKVQVYIREDESEYNLYLKTDRTTTTNKDDPDRASGKIEVISVDTADKAEEEALNVMKGNNYKHLVEFKIAKTSKLMDITELHIGRPIRIKTDDDIYDSYISAITLSDENFVYFKSGRLRITLLDKLKKSNNSTGNKLDVTGGKILGNLNILDNAYFGKNGVAFGAPYDTNEGGSLQIDGKDILKKNILLDSTIERIITGILTPASGANVLASTYVAVGKIIVIGLDLTAVEQISQYQPIAYFNNGGLLGNGYIYTTANEVCYLSKDKQSIDIHKSGGLAAGEKVYINAVAILNS